ncbi:MAG: SIS domain-containing protein [Verrucomicrobiota bacterium]|nr:SIS domain-containing protein [Verrucomicrobiota bacterium]
MKTRKRAKRIDGIAASILRSAGTIRRLLGRRRAIAAMSEAVVATLRSGGKILTAGNGGSATEAMHMAEELVGRFRGDRVSLPAVSLTADSSALTCIGNDFGFDRVFSRQVEGLGRPGDLLVLFSTSGRARNLSLALDAARRKAMRTACLLGRAGGALAGRADFEVIVPGSETARIQEAHQVILHLILEVVEEVWSR